MRKKQATEAKRFLVSVRTEIRQGSVMHHALSKRKIVFCFFARGAGFGAVGGGGCGSGSGRVSWFLRVELVSVL